MSSRAPMEARSLGVEARWEVSASVESLEDRCSASHEGQFPHEGRVLGHGASADENARMMFIVTFNGSSWLSDTGAELEGISGKDKASFRGFMETTVGDINLLQEHRLQG
eukprot:5394371-Pyramimonas_sp.AAC.1